MGDGGRYGCISHRSSSWYQSTRRDNARVVFARGYGTSAMGCLPEKNYFTQRRQAAKGEKIFFIAPLRLCEKKIISRKAAKPQRGSVFFCGMAPGISNSIYPQMVVVGANKYLESVIMVGMLMTSIWSITIGTYYSGSYPKSKIFYGSI